MTRDSLINELETSFSELEQSIAGLTAEQMLEPWYENWTVRDILGHIIGWHEASEDILSRISRGEKPVPEGTDYSDSDAWNARFAGIWRTRTPEAAVTELRASKQRFVLAAKHVPEDRFEDGRTANNVLSGNGTNHYNEHSAAIRKWRESVGY